MSELANEWFATGLAPKLLHMGLKDTMRIVYIAVEVSCSRSLARLLDPSTLS